MAQTIDNIGELLSSEQNQTGDALNNIMTIMENVLSY